MCDAVELCRLSKQVDQTNVNGIETGQEKGSVAADLWDELNSRLNSKKMFEKPKKITCANITHTHILIFVRIVS